MKKIIGHTSIISMPGGLDRPGLTRRQRDMAKELGIDADKLDAAGLDAFRKCSLKIADLEDQLLETRMGEDA